MRAGGAGGGIWGGGEGIQEFVGPAVASSLVFVAHGNKCERVYMSVYVCGSARGVCVQMSSMYPRDECAQMCRQPCAVCWRPTVVLVGSFRIARLHSTYRKTRTVYQILCIMVVRFVPKPLGLFKVHCLRVYYPVHFVFVVLVKYAF